jgi:hypothetical protein
MLSRAFSIVISSWLPCLALILPLGTFHTVNALVAGTVATVLAGFAMSHDRARYGAAIVGAWVAFTPFVYGRSTFTETVLAVSWGVVMFVHLIGPFAQEPQVSFVRPATQPRDGKPYDQTDEHDLPLAA